MPKYFYWIEHKGHRILVSDYRGLDADETIDAIDENVREITAVGDPMLPVLVDVRNTTAVEKKVMTRFRTAASEVKPFMSRTALLGLPDVQILFMNFITIITGVKTKAFADMEEAKDWLIEEVT